LSKPADKVDVHLKYKELEQDFSATLQETWLLLNQFFREYLPTFEVAQKLVLNVDLQQLASDLEGLAGFSAEGANLLVPKNRLTDNEALTLWLAAQYLGNKLGLLNSESLSKEELQVKLGKSSKIVSTRLGELIKTEYATKTSGDRFKITTYGTLMLQRDIIPKIKAKAKTP
jgi:hypothetical protein